jgi:hypothetical protein
MMPWGKNALLTISPQQDLRLWNLQTAECEKVHGWHKDAPRCALRIDSATILCCGWNTCFEWNVLTWQMTTPPGQVVGSWLSGKSDFCLANDHFALCSSDSKFETNGTRIYKRQADQTKSLVATLPKYSRALGWNDEDQLWVFLSYEYYLACYGFSGTMLFSIPLPHPWSCNFHGNVAGLHLAVVDEYASEFFILDHRTWTCIALPSTHPYLHTIWSVCASYLLAKLLFEQNRGISNCISNLWSNGGLGGSTRAP